MGIDLCEALARRRVVNWSSKLLDIVPNARAEAKKEKWLVAIVVLPVFMRIIIVL